jgi:hypothetical protein
MTAMRDPRLANRKTALVLSVIALAFFFGIMLKYVLTR